MDIPFGEWLPDLPPFGLQGCTIATNVIANVNSYRPFNSLVLFSNSIGSTAKGAIYATDPVGGIYNYVGDASALYSLVGQSFTTVTRTAGGNYSTNIDEFWEFVNWGNTVIGVNGFVDLPQQISLGASNFADLSIGVKAKHIGVMRDFVVLGNVSDSATNIYRVRWSALNNPTSFTVDAATLADFQDLPSEGGPIQKVLGGEYGVVLQKSSIWRMQFVGSPVVFQFDRVHNRIGAYAPQGCTRYQNLVFFLAEDGFYFFDGSGLVPIGRGKVDTFFFNDLLLVSFARIHATIDPINKLVMWAYPSSGGSIGGNPDKLICYSWAFDRWTLVEGINIGYFFQTITLGYTLDGLDAVSTNLDALPASLDSAQWVGGQILLGAFNSANRLAYFNGSAMAATVETGEFQLFKGKRAMLTEVRPDCLGVSASITTSVIIRNNFTESASVGAVATMPNATGFVPCRVNSRYFRIRLNTAPGVDFTHLMGVEVEGTPEGVR